MNELHKQKRIHSEKKSTKLVERFERYTLWIQGMGSIIEVAVQTQAGIACPVWAPIKFILQVSKDAAHAAEQVLRMIETTSECLPRLEIYEKLAEKDEILSATLVNVFTNIVNFAIKASDFYRQRTFGPSNLHHIPDYR